MSGKNLEWRERERDQPQASHLPHESGHIDIDIDIDDSINTHGSHRAISIMSAFWTVGCLSGAASVMLGAFGAHGLKSRINDPARLANWSTAAQYQVTLQAA